MHFRILGPTEVEGEAGLLPLGGAKQRAVLAVLLLHANRVVSRDRLVEGVWGEQPPETALSALQGYVSALRKTLGSDLIVTRPPGYVLETAPASVDLGLFESLVGEARDALNAGDAGPASERLREALGLWRGDPFADLDSAGFVQIERVRVEDLRLSALEDRLDADLTLGRHAELIPELHALVREHPFRERFRAQLMLALYRAGRQAEALDVYQHGRRLFAQELGLEPGEGLKRLQHAILEQDPAVGPPVRAPGRGARSPRQPRRRALGVVIAIVLLAAIAIGLAITLTQGGGKVPAVRPDSLAVVDTRTNQLAADVQIGGEPVAVAANGKGVYVASEREGIVWLVDPFTRKIVRKIGVGADVHDLALGFGSVWLADGTDGTVTRLDDQLREIQGRIPLRRGKGEAPAFWVATDATGVWVARGDLLERIDPDTNRVSKTIPVPSPSGLAAGLGGVFVGAGERFLGLSPSSRESPRTYALPGIVAAPTVGRNAVWAIAYNGEGEVWRFGQHLGTAGIVSGSEGRYPLDLAVGGGAVWTVDTQGLVSRIDPRAMQVVSTIRTAPTIRSSIAYADGDLWVAVHGPR